MKPAALLSFILAALILVAGCRPGKQVLPLPVDSVPRYAILSAFEPELKSIRSHTRIEAGYTLNGRTISIGVLAGHPVVLGLSGVSMVNAAMSTQVIVDYFTVRGIIYSGIAGGVNPDLGIGDVVIPAQWAQYQEQLFARRDGTGWDTGWHRAEFGNYGMMFPQPVSVTRQNGPSDREQERFWFPVDQDLLAAARAAAGQAVLSQCTRTGKCLGASPVVVVGGNGVSGPTFVDNAEYRNWVWSTFQADALDMESAAVAQVAYANQVPFIAVRSLSDLAGGGPGQNELPVFLDLAADNSTQLLLALLQELDSP